MTTATITANTAAAAPAATTRRSWKAIVRRMFELWAEPYSNGPYQPL